MYRHIQSFWQQGYGTGLLQNVTVLSLGGGVRDTLIRSELCNLTPLLPSSHSLSVLSSGVTGLWAPVDHNAGVWCNELVVAVSRLLYDILDPVTQQDSRDVATR